jgi:hypothetical protein
MIVPEPHKAFDFSPINLLGGQTGEAYGTAAVAERLVCRYRASSDRGDFDAVVQGLPDVVDLNY